MCDTPSEEKSGLEQEVLGIQRENAKLLNRKNQSREIGKQLSRDQ